MKLNFLNNFNVKNFNKIWILIFKVLIISILTQPGCIDLKYFITMLYDLSFVLNLIYSLNNMSYP